VRDGMLYALAALGAVTLARWLLLLLAWIVSYGTGLDRRLRRAVWRHDLALIASPDWQASFEQEARRYVEDFEAALPPAYRPARE
jgi:hypothetical protein